MLERFWHTDRALSELDGPELQRWIDMRQRRGIRPATIVATLKYLRMVVATARRAGWAGADPTKQVVAPRPVARVSDTFTPDELEAVLERIRSWPGIRLAHRDAAILEALWRTGMRRAELSRLRPGDIDPARRLVTIAGKTGQRTVPVSDRALVVLRQVVPVGSVAVLQMLADRWRRRLNEPRLRCHNLRHSFATALVDAGVPLPTVARLLGHSPRSLAITQLYYGPGEASLRRAVEKL